MYRRTLLSTAVILAAVTFSPSRVNSDSADVLRGDVVIGVDPLGRVLLAVDRAPKDGRVDQFFLFTAAYRLEPTASRRVKNGVLVVKTDQLKLVSRDFRADLRIRSGGTPPREAASRSISGDSLSNRDGLELVNQPNPAGEYVVSLADLKVEDEYSGWPLSFEYDVLDPGSNCRGVELNCTSGGSGSSNCSIAGCPKPPTGCSVACDINTHVPCCGCTGTPGGYARCRCILCPTPR